MLPRLGFISALSLGAMMALGACKGRVAPAEGHDPQVANAPQVAETAAAQAAAAPEPGYTVNVELPPKATKGAEAIARVHVAPTGPWHMNLDYPAKLRLASSNDIALDAKLLRKADAERYDDDGLVFSVLFTPNKKGEHTIDAEIDFAVCGDAACGPVTEAVQLAFEVTCSDGDALC